MKKVIYSIFLITTFCLLNAAENYSFKKDKAIVDSKKAAMSNRTSIQVVKDMQTGWNLGNTLDATGTKGLTSETSWGQPYTTKSMIDNLANSGVKTIRIPVSWSNHFIDKDYTIDPEWMSRVKQIVDWAYEDGMYIILNTHHDNYEKNSLIPRCGGYYPTKENYDESSRFIKNVWAQISLAFNNGYDEKLVFETMNEPRPRNTNDEWVFNNNSELSLECAQIVNKLNQDALDTIRSSGGNNKKRLVSIPALQASPDSALSEYFVLPEDSVEGRLVLSVHMYSPYNFAMESPGVKVFTNQMGSYLAVTFKNLNNKFVTKGIPVIIGEYGATNKNNLEERVKWFQAFLKYSRKYGMTSCLWDNGEWLVKGNDYSEKYGYFNRKTCAWYFPQIIQTIREETR